jgi:hypothetical protein
MLQGVFVVLLIALFLSAPLATAWPDHTVGRPAQRPTYDDSDGWYDHVMPPIVNQSSDPAEDALLGATGLCGTAATGRTKIAAAMARACPSS